MNLCLRVFKSIWQDETKRHDHPQPRWLRPFILPPSLCPARLLPSSPRGVPNVWPQARVFYGRTLIWIKRVNGCWLPSWSFIACRQFDYLRCVDEHWGTKDNSQRKLAGLAIVVVIIVSRVVRWPARLKQGPRGSLPAASSPPRSRYTNSLHKHTFLSNSDRYIDS